MTEKSNKFVGRELESISDTLWFTSEGDIIIRYSFTDGTGVECTFHENDGVTLKRAIFVDEKDECQGIEYSFASDGTKMSEATYEDNYRIHKKDFTDNTESLFLGVVDDPEGLMFGVEIPVDAIKEASDGQNKALIKALKLDS